MSNILIVEDEPKIAEILMEYLINCGHQASTCTNAEDALSSLRTTECQLIISDIKMPRMSGVELYQEYKTLNNSTARFVLMTGYSDLMDVQNAYRIGIDEIIAKPFDLDILKLVVDYLLQTKEAFGSEDVRYFAVPIDDLVAKSQNEYSIFLKLNYKFMCVTKTGQDFTMQRLQNLANKGIKFVYLNSKDYSKYADLHFLSNDNKNIRPLDNAKKVIAYNSLTNFAAKHPVLKVLDQRHIVNSVSALHNYSQAIFNQHQLSEIYTSYVQESPHLATKSALIAILTSSIADLWKWNSPRIQSRLVLGSLLCDIGLTKSPQLMNKKRIQYMPEDVIAYEQHPVESHKMLSHIVGIPEEILLIALQHHENISNNGFPNKLPRTKIHSFSKLVQGVNEFVDALLLQPDKSNAQAALNQLSSFQSKMVSEQVIKSLYMIFNLPIPTELESLLLPDMTNRVL